MRPAPRTDTGAVAALLPDGRLHLQEGPIDLVIEAMAPEPVRQRAFQAAARAFDGLLEGLTRHLTALRRPVDAGWPADASPTAERMRRAVSRFEGGFVTPMAAVAGSVADTVLDAIRRVPGIEAAYVNNRGDIALRVTPARPLDIGVVTALRRCGIGAGIHVESGAGIGGIATSGWDGRSFSLGIADAVTVLAADAATADAAATVIASAVDVDHPAIGRAPARTLDPDTDLGGRLVTTSVAVLDEASIEAALARGADLADRFCREGHIRAAFLALQGRAALCGRTMAAPSIRA